MALDNYLDDWLFPYYGAESPGAAPPPADPPWSGVTITQLGDLFPTPDAGPITPAPAPSGGNGGGASGSGGLQAGPTNFVWPTFSAPRYEPPANFQAPDPFTYPSFTVPTLADAQNEPGYQFAAEEGAKRLENSAAARGVLRTGGTLKDILAWGNRFAEQNYGNVFNRAATTYGINRANAADIYSTNYGISRDVWDRNTQLSLDTYDRNYQAALAEFNPQFRAAELTFSDMYNRWRDLLNSTTQIATAGAGL